MNRDANKVALAAHEQDDLQRITGIGPKFARALYQLGINNYADLLPDFDLQIIEVTVSAETEESCDAHIHFVLSGADSVKLTSQRVPYQIELQTLDLIANTVNQRLESEILYFQPDISDYHVRRTLPMPNPGRYELQTGIYIHAPAEKAACYTGPTLNIV